MWLLLAALIGWNVAISDINREHMKVECRGIVGEYADSCERSYIHSFPYGEGKPGLMVARLIRELIVDASNQNEEFLAFQGIPFRFAESGIVLGSEPAMHDGLTGKYRCPCTFGKGMISIFVTNFVLDITRAHTDAKWRNGGLRLCEKGRQSPSVHNIKFEGQSIFVLNKTDAADREHIYWVDPRPLLGLHLFESAKRNGPLFVGVMSAVNNSSGTNGSSGPKAKGFGNVPAPFALMAGCLLIVGAIKLLLYAFDGASDSFFGAAFALDFIPFGAGAALVFFCFFPGSPSILGFGIGSWHSAWQSFSSNASLQVL